MRQIIFALIIATYSAAVLAEWVKIAETNETVFYIDPGSIRKDGNSRKAWLIQDYKVRVDGALSMRVYEEYDCHEGRSRSLSLSAHSENMASGKVIYTGSNPNPNPPWDYIAPDTAPSLALKMVCSK